MEIESTTTAANQVNGTANVVPPQNDSANTVKVIKPVEKMDESPKYDSEKEKNQITDVGVNADKKKLAQSTIDNSMSEINSKIKLSNTQLKYSVDDETQRIMIKVVDKDTDKVVREIPPEETLEAIKKIWEIAGIIVDEKC